MVARAFDPNAQQRRERITMSTQPVPGEPWLHKETLSLKRKNGKERKERIAKEIFQLKNSQEELWEDLGIKESLEGTHHNFGK